MAKVIIILLVGVVAMFELQLVVANPIKFKRGINSIIQETGDNLRVVDGFTSQYNSDILPEVRESSNPETFYPDTLAAHGETNVKKYQAEEIVQPISPYTDLVRTVNEEPIESVSPYNYETRPKNEEYQDSLSSFKDAIRLNNEGYNDSPAYRDNVHSVNKEFTETLSPYKDAVHVIDEGLVESDSPYKDSVNPVNRLAESVSPYKDSVNPDNGLAESVSTYKDSVNPANGLYEPVSPYKDSVQPVNGLGESVSPYKDSLYPVNGLVESVSSYKNEPTSVIEQNLPAYPNVDKVFETSKLDPISTSSSYIQQDVRDQKFLDSVASPQQVDKVATYATSNLPSSHEELSSYYQTLPSSNDPYISQLSNFYQAPPNILPVPTGQHVRTFTTYTKTIPIPASFWDSAPVYSDYSNSQDSTPTLPVELPYSLFSPRLPRTPAYESEFTTLTSGNGQYASEKLSDSLKDIITSLDSMKKALTPKLQELIDDYYSTNAVEICKYAKSRTQLGYAGNGLWELFPNIAKLEIGRGNEHDRFLVFQGIRMFQSKMAEYRNENVGIDSALIDDIETKTNILIRQLTTKIQASNN